MDLDEAKEKPYYWTAFAVSGVEPDVLHCTHKFLGDLSDEDAISVGDILVDYFTDNEYQPFEALFDKEEFFGENQDVRVLTTQEPISSFYQELRNKIDKYRSDDFSYNPHMTTEQKSVLAYLDRYVFMRGDEILAEW